MVQVTSAFTPVHSCNQECQPWERLPLQCWREPRAAERAGTWSPSGQGNMNQAGAQTCDCISSYALVKPFSLAQTHVLFSHQLTPAQRVNVIHQLPAKLKCIGLCSLVLLEDCLLLLLICQPSGWIQPCLPTIPGLGCCSAICRVTRQSLHSF